jgi:hypothetical protein
VPFESDALLLCSDGLSDLVPSSEINQIVRRFAGRPQQVVRASSTPQTTLAVRTTSRGVCRGGVRGPSSTAPPAGSPPTVRAALVVLLLVLSGIVLARTPAISQLACRLVGSLLFAGRNRWCSNSSLRRHLTCDARLSVLGAWRVRDSLF